MTLAGLALALAALLLTPGPTNTLVMLSGADRGLRATILLIPVELLAYLCTVVPLTLLAHVALPHIAALRPTIALLAGVWVLSLALRMWREPTATASGRAVTPATLFVTTLLNPKALIFGVVLLPSAPLAQGLPLFAALVVIVAAVWAAIGCLLPRRGYAGAGLFLRRAAACWLAILSVGIVATGLSA